MNPISIPIRSRINAICAAEFHPIWSTCGDHKSLKISLSKCKTTKKLKIVR
jgi:hypothetical protein